MLDFEIYRTQEERAKSALEHWILLRQYDFIKYPFKGLSNLQQLATFMESNSYPLEGSCADISLHTQENKSRENAIQNILEASNSIHNFLSMFFQKEIAIPLKTIAHSLVVYLRMQAIKPNFQSVFEIGAGGGY